MEEFEKSLLASDDEWCEKAAIFSPVLNLMKVEYNIFFSPHQQFRDLRLPTKSN